MTTDEWLAVRYLHDHTVASQYATIHW